MLKKLKDPKLCNVVYLSLTFISPKEFEEKHERWWILKLDIHSEFSKSNPLRKTNFLWVHFCVRANELHTPPPSPCGFTRSAPTHSHIHTLISTGAVG